MPADRRSGEHRTYRGVRRRLLLPRAGRHRAVWGLRRPGSRFTAVQAVVAAVLVLAGLPAAVASFTATTGNAGNSFVGTVAFPTYPAAVLADVPLLQHRGEDTVSAADTSAAADSSGNADPGTYQGRTDGPAAWYKFDEGSGGVGTASADSSGSAGVATLAGANVGWATGKLGSSLATTTGSGYATATTPVRTDQSFSVSTWAMVTTFATNETMVSQLGTTSSAFFLKYNLSFNNWRFEVPRTDATSPTVDQVGSTVTPVLNRWDHVVGVYDDAGDTIKLYVNGTLQGSAAKTVDWNAAGVLSMGRSQWNGAPGDQFLGRIDDVRMYQRALSGSDVANLYQVPASVWEFSEGAGSTTADVSGHGNTGTLTNAVFTGSGHTGAGASFDGSGDSVVSAAAPVATNTSFTASVWANMDVGGADRTVLSQAGTISSLFAIRFDSGMNRWAVDFMATNVASPTVTQLLSAASPVLDTWYHLAVVYDDDLDTITFYVNGAAGRGTVTADWLAVGALTAGQKRWNSAPIESFDGFIDDVRVYDHALNNNDIAALYSEPTARYDLGEGTGTTTADGSGHGGVGTLAGGAAWVTSGANIGPSGSTTVTMDGVNDVISTNANAVHTNQSFSVSAWARLTDTPASPYAVVSQDGNGVGAGFVLQYDGAGDWEFYTPRTDADTGTLDSSSGGTPTTGLWTHLVGVYDDAAGAVRLYVNGVAVTAGTHSDANEWDAAGNLLIGQRKQTSAYDREFKGQIDDVRTFQNALTAAQAAAIWAETPQLRWELDEGSGTAVADSSKMQNTGVNSNSAAWHATGHTDGSFYGTTSSVASNGPVLNTAANFTVSAWARLESKATPRTVASQEGATYRSGFVLQYDDGLDDWSFIMYGGPSSGDTRYHADTNVGVTLNTWYHVAGVYDQISDKMRLYINGDWAASTAITSSHNAPGDFMIARAVTNGVSQEYWNGRLDEVHAYQKALTGDEIQAEYLGQAQAVFPTYNFTSPITAERPGALQGAQQGMQASTAVAFNGTAGASNDDFYAGPAAFTISCWIKTRGTQGGQVLGFSTSETAMTGTTTDRMIYVDSGGKLTFGVNPASGFEIARSTNVVNDGAWHHVTASGGGAGMKLYVDGVRTVNAAVFTAKAHSGYWRWGGAEISASWPTPPTSNMFLGSIDEVAIWHSQLTDVQVAIQYHANH